MDSSQIERGTFIRELKNRFLCTVSINGESTECYIPSSCRLENFIALEGRTVFLLPNKSPNARTRYSIFAVRLGRQNILLNLSYANQIIDEGLGGRRFSFLGPRTTVYRERTIAGYKSDLFIADTKTLIEIKSLLSFDEVAFFPSIDSERRIKQLSDLSALLQGGFRVAYFLVSLNPKVHEIQISTEDEAFTSLFRECVERGMIVRGIAVKLRKGRPTIDRMIPVSIDHPYASL